MALPNHAIKNENRIALRLVDIRRQLRPLWGRLLKAIAKWMCEMAWRGHNCTPGLGPLRQNKKPAS